ncbi:MAG: CopG family transcriptional regulator [Terriglobales bacterium]
MRTTLAIDDDTYERLQREMRKRGCSFREAVNEYLRRGLDAVAMRQPRKPFKVQTFPGGPAPGVNLDCISRLLDQLDGPGWR